jgi:replicative DNA helicase
MVMPQRVPEDPVRKVGPTDGRPPPADLDAEAAVLSAVLLDQTGATLDEVRATWGERKVLYSDSNQLIFEACCAVVDEGDALDIVTLATRLRAEGKLDRVGGTPYIGKIIDMTPYVANVGEHAQIVFDAYRARQAIALAKSTTMQGYSRPASATDLQRWLETIEVGFADIAHSSATARLRPISEYIAEVDSTVRNANQSASVVSGVTFGFAVLDARTTGAHDGDLVIIAGRPGSGKTALAIAMARRMAEAGYAVPFFSLEMPGAQLAMRLVSVESGINLLRLRSGRLDKSEWKPFNDAIAKLSTLPIFVDDTAAVGPFDLRAQTKRLQREVAAGRHPAATQNRLGAVYVDYLQLMSPARQMHSREQDIASISRDLKNLAKQLAIPVLALAQLNREVERRPDKRPQLSDLRESGSIEQEADSVMFVYRPAMYKPDDPALEGWAEICVAKQRNGPTGVEKLAFDGKTARFENLERAGSAVYDPPRQGVLPLPPDDFDDDFDDSL